MGKRLRTSGQGNSHQSKHRNSSLTLIVLWKWLTRDVPTERKQIGRGTFHQPHRPSSFPSLSPYLAAAIPHSSKELFNICWLHMSAHLRGRTEHLGGKKRKKEKRKEGRGWASVAERGEGPKLKPLELLRTRPVGHSNGWSYWEIGGV